MTGRFVVVRVARIALVSLIAVTAGCGAPFYKNQPLRTYRHFIRAD